MGNFGPACLLLACAMGGAPLDSGSLVPIGGTPSDRTRGADTLVVEVCGGAEVVAPLTTTHFRYMSAAQTCCDVAADSTVAGILDRWHGLGRQPLVMVLVIATDWSVDSIAAHMRIARPPKGWRNERRRDLVPPHVVLRSDVRLVRLGSVSRCPVLAIVSGPEDTTEKEWSALLRGMNLRTHEP